MEKKITTSSRVIILAIAEILFFSFFIKGEIAHKNITEEQKEFLWYYQKIGKINLIFLFFSFLSLGLNLLFQEEIRWYTTNIFSSITLLISITSIIFAIWGYRFNFTYNPNLQIIPILKCFIPIYNFKLRYSKNDYTTPSRRLKESILWRTIVIIGRCFWWNTIGIYLLILLLWRIVLICCKRDIIPNIMKQDINKTFWIYPQEIFVYCYQQYKIRKWNPLTKEEFQTKLEDYQTITPINKKAILQYGILLMLMGWSFLWRNTITQWNISMIIQILFWIFFIMIIMIHYHYKRGFQKIPILQEIFNQ